MIKIYSEKLKKYKLISIYFKNILINKFKIYKNIYK